MHQRSSLSLYKSFLRQRFHWYSIPKHSFLSKSVCTVSSQAASVPRTTISGEPMRRLLYLPSCSPSHHFRGLQNMRHFKAQSSGDFDKDRVVDQINLKFAEAREEIEAALDSKETVYFDEEAECARAAVKEVLDMFEDLLGMLEDKERDAVRRSMGLKIEQLKAELQQLND